MSDHQSDGNSQEGGGAPSNDSQKEVRLTASNRPSSSTYVYQDHSHERAEPLWFDQRFGNLFQTADQKRKLPAKLNSMLSDPDLAAVITWLPHGRSWRIIDRHHFINTVLPAYFDHKNFTSFVRLVNAWGFRRIPSGSDRDSYYHELFLRGMPHLHLRMRRLTTHESKAPINDEDRFPNFYEMPLLDETANALAAVRQNTGASSDSSDIAASAVSGQTQAGAIVSNRNAQMTSGVLPAGLAGVPNQFHFLQNVAGFQPEPNNANASLMHYEFSQGCNDLHVQANAAMQNQSNSNQGPALQNQAQQNVAAFPAYANFASQYPQLNPQQFNMLPFFNQNLRVPAAASFPEANFSTYLQNQAAAMPQQQPRSWPLQVQQVAHQDQMKNQICMQAADQPQQQLIRDNTRRTSPVIPSTQTRGSTTQASSTTPQSFHEGLPVITAAQLMTGYPEMSAATASGTSTANNNSGKNQLHTGVMLPNAAHEDQQNGIGGLSNPSGSETSDGQRKHPCN